MFLQLWFLVVAVSQIPQISSSTSSTTQHPAASPLLHKKSTPPVVYTAEKSRKEPFPSYSTPTIATNLGELYDEIKPEGTKHESENNGFVEPLDFNSFLSDVSYKGKKSDNLPPLFTSESNAKDTFADFFKSGTSGNGRNSFVEPNFGLASSASDQKSRKHNNRPEEEYGFVDPNVQFRSLFDSSETADGFRPQDFLGSKSDSAGADPSKGSQTRAFPQFTYTGRNGQNGQNRDDGDDYESQPNNKYRSSYRQVDSRDRDERDDRERDDRPNDPYDDSSYYNGENDDSPPPPPNPRRQYQNQNSRNNNNGYSQRYGPASNQENNNQNYPAVQESSHTPQASGSKASESGPGKGKCKKVEKEVDYNEDYAGYTDPEPDYDPSTYGQNERYKRQAGGRGRQQKSNKRPMTCYVCEDEQGRYAERCSYDSKGDPKGGNGNFYTSSSTSFGDNRRPGNNGRSNGGSDRYRRNPSLSASKSVAVSTTTAASASTVQVPVTTENSSDRDKRQSPGGGGGGGDRGRNNNQDFQGDDYGDNSSERGGQGRDRDNYDDYSGEADYEGPSQGGRGGRGGGRDDNFNYSGPGSQRSGSNRDDDYEGPSTTSRGPGGRNRGNNNNDENDYGFGPPQRGSSNNRGQDFDFGPPSDFGRDAGSSASNNNQGFNFDFSIPREFDPEGNLGTSNTNNRPVFSGNNNNNGNDFGFGNFDAGYDDYIKKYFPGAFGPGGDDGGHSTPGPSPSSTSYRPHGHSSSSPSPPLRGHSPNKEHTQQSHNYAPPPYFQRGHPDEGHGGHGGGHGGGGGGGGGGHFDKIMGDFSQRDRSGCQRYEKDGMICYLCRDSRGMKKEDCMMAQGDPNGKNTRVAYHESTEYSSPPASVLPLPRSVPSTTVASKVVKPSLSAAESKVSEKKKSPVDYDFDY